MFPNISTPTYLFLLFATLDFAFARRGGGSSGGSKKISDGATIGICVGIVGPIIVIGAILKYYEWRDKKKKREMERLEAQAAEEVGNVKNV